MKTNTIDAARRSQTSSSRCTIREIDDDHLVQQIKTADTFHSESATDVEAYQPVGITTVNMKQKEDQSQQGQQSGGGGQDGGGGKGSGDLWNKNQPKGESAEGMMSYMNGSRSHPMCGMIDDRRVRPYGQKEGEGQFYAPCGCGQTIYHRRQQDDKDGLYFVTLDDQQQSGGGGASGGGAQARAGDGGGSSGGGQQQKRIVSIAHVEKKKQGRKAQQSGGASGSGGGSGGQQQGELPDGSKSNYKHEGDTVNTEVRLDSTRIQFFKKTPASSGQSGSQQAEVGALAGAGGSGGAGGGSKKRQDGELRGYWDNNEQSWWWKADKNITHDAGAVINLNSPKIKHDTQKQVFTGDVHILKNLYVGEEAYKPSNSDWLAGKPDPSMESDTPLDEADVARQIENRRRRLLLFQAISVDDDGNVTVTGNLAISGNLTVGGVITARDFVRS